MTENYNQGPNPHAHEKHYGESYYGYGKYYPEFQEMPYQSFTFERKPENKIFSFISGLFRFVAVIAVIGFLCSFFIDDNNSDANLSPYPVYNGKIIIAPDYECLCPLQINAESGMNCYVRLRYVGEPSYSDVRRRLNYWSSGSYESDIAFYVEAGRTVEVEVPIGVYKFYYATGKIFYGTKDLFGEKTSCYSSEENLYFYVDDDTYSGQSITLRKVPHGNFRTHSVNRKSFPTS